VRPITWSLRYDARVRVWMLLLGLLGGCTPVQRAFHCNDSRACVNGGVQGSCEASGWCSFPDAACGSGRRYGEFAGGGLGRQCVGVADSCGTIGEACCTGNVCQSKLACIAGVCSGCVQSLAVGGGHGCALLSDGTMACWGKNDHGQLGNGGTSDAAAAVAVVDDHGVKLAGIVAIAAGAAHSCALRSDGTVLCWGDDSAGQLGRGGAAPINLTPMPVGLSTIVAIAAGARHSCAALMNGAAWCWGANDSGQLGSAPSAGSSMPVEVVDGASQPISAALLAGGDTHSCAVARDFSLSCWGSNTSGELGDGTTAATSGPKAAASLGKHVRAIAAGAHFGCALVDDGGVRCFGQNDAGQAGQPPGAPVAVPTAVAALDLVTAVAAGGAQACARRAGGRFYCWGAGSGAPSLVRASVGAIGVGAGDRCSARADGVDCAVFGDPHLACP
jgi:Regulator of Chromosome Condensation (RCC1) repeat protein